ncbi:MAG TPA: pitrilysin family protein [Polyangiales bacterium]|nr:pitrilysin family protein [Polyangiales bacterium]
MTVSERDARLVTEDGSLLLVEEDHALPLVHVGVILRTGSVHDPRGLEGLTRMTARMLRMGTRSMTPQQVEEKIDSLGAQLSVGCAPSYVQLGGVVVAHNLEAFVRLISELITAPAFRARDLSRAKREGVAELISACDDDRSLAARNFRSFTLGKHPYARSVVGSTGSVRAITRERVLDHYRKHFVSENVIISMAGAVEGAHAAALVERYLRLPKGRAPKDHVPPPKLDKGRRVLIVDKPQRTQTQIIIGTLGTHTDDPDHNALLVANVVFGGLFTARLTHEVRSVRGLSYGASSSLNHDRERELWSMWTFPAAKDARQCIDLQLRLYDEWIVQGVKPAELTRAKNFLIKSHAFEIDTAQKRLDQRVERELFGLPADYHDGFVDHVRKVTRTAANEALVRRLSRRDQSIVLVATAKELKPELASLPHVRDIKVVPFDRV